MNDLDRKKLLRAYFAGNWMMAQLISGADNIVAEDCWDTADSMLAAMDGKKEVTPG